jgi:hypothetical protein
MEQAMLSSLGHLARIQGYDVKVGGIMAVVNNPRDPSQCVNPLFANDDVINATVDRALTLGLETAVERYKANL